MLKKISSFLVLLQLFSSTNFLIQSVSGAALFALSQKVYAVDSANGLPTQPKVVDSPIVNNVNSNPNYDSMYNYGKSIGDKFRDTATGLNPAINGKVNKDQMDFTTSFPSNVTTEYTNSTSGVITTNEAFKGYNYDSANSTTYAEKNGAGKYGDPKGLDSLLADKSVTLSTENSPQGEAYRLLTNSKPRTKFSGAVNEITKQSSNALNMMDANKGFTVCKTSNPGTPIDYFCGQNNLDNQMCFLERDLKSKRLISLTADSDVRKGQIVNCGVGCYELQIGDPTDNNFCGQNAILDQTVTAEVFDPSSITDVRIEHVEYDDWLKILINDKTAWADWNDPPYERSRTWMSDPNLDITDLFKSEAIKNSKVKLTSRLGASGCGEGLYKMTIRYDVSKALLESEWDTNNSCYQNALRIHNGKCTGSISCQTDFMSISEIPLNDSVFQIPQLFPSVAKTCKKIQVQTGSCQKVNVTSGASKPANVIYNSGNNMTVLPTDTFNSACPSGTIDEGDFCLNESTGLTTVKPIIKKYCDIGYYRSNSVGAGDSNGNYCTSPVYTPTSVDEATLNSWSALGKCDQFVLNNECQFMSSECGLRDFASGTCQISKNKFTCQKPGVMTCTNEGTNPFTKCVETTQEVNDTMKSTISDPKSCMVIEAPSKGSCSFTNNISITSVNNVPKVPDEDPCEMYYNSNTACKVVSSTDKTVNLQLATVLGTSSDPDVNLTTTTGSAKCSVYTKDNSCQALSTYTCSNTLGFTDANAPLMSYPGYKGIPKICQSVSVNYNCHVNNRMNGTDESGNSYTSFEAFAKDDCSGTNRISENPKCVYKSTECVQDSGSSYNGECYMKMKNYECGAVASAPVKKTVKSNSCSTAPAEINTSFGKAASNISALQQINNEAKSCGNGRDRAALENCEIFKGQSYSCKRDAFGGLLVDCCDMPSGADLNSYIGQLMVMQKFDSMMMSMDETMVGGAWADYVHNPIADSISNFGDTAMSYATKTWDSISTSFTSAIESTTGATLKTADAASAATTSVGETTTEFFGGVGFQQWAENQVGNFIVDNFGEETASLLFEQTVGTTAQNNFVLGGAIGGPLAMVMVIYMYYQMVMAIAQMIWQCKKEEQELSYKRDIKTCHLVERNYCHAYLNCMFCKICIEYRDRYCCFSSPLSRIMMEQIKPQLGIGWGSGKDPNCSGLKIGQIGLVDFSRVDLSEWINMLKVSNVLPLDNPNFQNVTGKGNTTWNNLTPDRKNVYDRTAERMTDMTSNKVDKTIEGVKDGAWNSGKN
ncbi:MAG: conjugal transfer protein TraN [Sulfurihydrogenibium sp.]|jgi:conjugal transfer mating pair stabilization protein TraN|nr:conjugal transfer protein TraN [Sulfurihydrogenibium sp.]